MSFERTIAMLKAVQSVASDPGEWRRKAARAAWTLEILHKWQEAQRAIDERCGEAVERLGSAAFNRLFEAEQAKVDAIRAEIDAVRDRELWPKHLYWGCI
jgi:hypothetical protein